MNSKNFLFNKHTELIGQHALFSPSQSAWLRYDEEKIIDKIRSQYRAPIGSEIHEYAAQEIMMSQKITMPRKKNSIKAIAQEIESYIYTKYKSFSNASNSLECSEYGMTLIENMSYLPREVFEAVKYYINDAIGYKMVVEQPLVYSKNIYGTADAIIFKDNLLRIHDLKTGSNEPKLEQLLTYAALFCLEYDIKPSDIEFELRLYHCDGIIKDNPTVEDLLPIIDSIVTIEKIAYGVEKENK